VGPYEALYPDKNVRFLEIETLLQMPHLRILVRFAMNRMRYQIALAKISNVLSSMCFKQPVVATQRMVRHAWEEATSFATKWVHSFVVVVDL
jgi:energy-converting hydrogenase Eha subunit A